MKNIFTCLLLLFISLQVIAQSPVRFGLRAGYNFSHFGGMRTHDKSALKGIDAGAIASFDLDSISLVQLEVNYSRQGSVVQTIDSLGATTATDKFFLDYVNLTILPKVKLASFLSFGFGIQTSFLLKAQDNYSRNDSSAAFDKTLDFHRLDFAALGFVGFDFLQRMQLGARYRVSIVNLNKSFTFQDLSKENSIYNRTLEIYFDFLFGKSKFRKKKDDFMIVQ